MGIITRFASKPSLNPPRTTSKSSSAPWGFRECRFYEDHGPEDRVNPRLREGCPKRKIRLGGSRVEGEADGTHLGRSQRLYAILRRADFFHCPAVPHQMVTPRHGTRPHDPDDTRYILLFRGHCLGTAGFRPEQRSKQCPAPARRNPHSVLVIRGWDILGTHAQDPGRAV